MRKIIIPLLAILVFTACKNEANQNNEEPTVDETSYVPYGAEMDTEDAISGKTLLAKYKELKAGDTVDVKVKTKVNEVCQKKGCWMMAALDDAEEVRVSFKDYGFFVPLNAAESEAVIQGKAFLSVTSVKDLQHYAEDAGKSEAEINEITEPEIGYGLIADAVLLGE